jgi:hypothetical protein
MRQPLDGFRRMRTRKFDNVIDLLWTATGISGLTFLKAHPVIFLFSGRHEKTRLAWRYSAAITAARQERFPT